MALIAPIFFLLLFVIGETALLYFAERSMERTVAATAELVRSGHARASAMSRDQFRAALCGRLTPIIDCQGSNFFLDVRAFEQFSEIDIESPLRPDHGFDVPSAFDYGEPGDIVIVRTFYHWRTNPIHGSLGINSLGNGKRLISAVAAFRNEPFADDGAGRPAP